MKKYILIILALFLLTSCSVLKDKVSGKTKRSENKETIETERITTFRDSDTIQISVPHFKYKDTTIVKRGKTSTAYVNFDQKGGFDIRCIEDKIAEMREIERKITEQNEIKEKTRTKKKESELKPVTILYFFIGFAIFIVILFVALMFYVKNSVGSITKLIP